MISVVIVGHQEFEVYTKAAVESIRRFEPSVEIVLVDNASPIPYSASPRYKLMRFNKLISYAQAMNRGYGHTVGEWIVFINNDILCTGAFAESVESLPVKGLYTVGIRAKDNFHGSGLKFRYPHGWIVVVHRQTFELLGKWDNAYQGAACEDLDIGLACEKHNVPMSEVPFPFTHFDKHTRTDIPGWLTRQRHNVDYLIKKWSKPVESQKVIEVAERIKPDERGIDLYYKVQGHIKGRLMMWPVDVAVLYSMVNRDGNHLEIGCYDGGSAVIAALTKIQNRCEGTIYTVDARNGDVMENAKLFGCQDRIKFYNTALPPLPEELDNVGFETCLIDGDHIAPAPARDWALVKDRVDNFVAFHDLHFVGAKGAFAAACADDDWEVQFAQSSHTRVFDVPSILKNPDAWRDAGSIGVVERLKHDRWIR